ncbi:hypothetical protein BUE76_20420 [Cnuella takakiae]|nr:hypothetical protein BUE76_20420 [Cnuella takakiae]
MFDNVAPFFRAATLVHKADTSYYKQVVKRLLKNVFPFWKPLLLGTAPVKMYLLGNDCIWHKAVKGQDALLNTQQIYQHPSAPQVI